MNFAYFVLGSFFIKNTKKTRCFIECPQKKYVVGYTPGGEFTFFAESIKIQCLHTLSPLFPAERERE